MPLGLRFLPAPKKVKEAVCGESGKSSALPSSGELKTLSDPLLSSSYRSAAAEFICKSESVHILTTPYEHSSIDIDIGTETGTTTEGDDNAGADHFGSDRNLDKSTSDSRINEKNEPEENPLDDPVMIGSFFDRNGNPVDDDDEEEEDRTEVEEIPPEQTELPPPQPKCFINAAELLDEQPEYVPSPPPSLLFATPSTSAGPPRTESGSPSTRRATASPGSSGIPVRRRVPISKSFPDIIQTTILPRRDEDDSFNFKVTQGQRGTSREPQQDQMLNSIVADSLEEIRAPAATSTVPVHRDSIDVSDGAGRIRVFERIEPVMTESVMAGGITSEKPPETWIVDFNSFTSEGEDEQRSRGRCKSTSSTNSLTYFLSMDEVDCPEPSTTQNRQDPLTASTDSQKMIFSMFVDIGDKDGPKTKPIVGESATTAANSIVPGSSRSAKKADSKDLRLKVLHSGIPKYSHPHFNFGGVKDHDFKNEREGGGGSMSSSMMMSSIVSDVDRNQFPGTSNRSSLHVANHEHDGSFTSSILSSMEMSAVDDSDVCQGGPCFKLGMDLLRMFQEGINTDVAISVRGRFVKAHKCILASRSQYFAAMLSGNWIQKAGNTIHLDEFSYNTVQFTMYHIYSGTNEIPDSIDLMELATLTEMLGLEGLKEVISQTIRTRFCHNFHRPCTGCIAGILEFFPLAVSNGMDELQRKMTKWICKHFVRIWPTKAFASLGEPLVDKCLGFSVTHLSPENLLDVTLGCDQLLSTMPTVRWTEAIFATVIKLNEACTQYIGEHLSEVLQSQRFLLFGKGQTWNISRIENTFLEGILLLKADEACLSHVALCRLIELGTVTIDEVEWSTMFVVFLKMLRSEVEKFLLANASKAVLSKNWEKMSQDVRKRICATSFQNFDKSGNRKAPVKTAGMPPSSVGTPVPTPRNSRTAQSPSSSSVRGTSRISPQQPKVAEPITPRKNSNAETDFSDSQIPSPLPISESSQKSVSTKSIASVRPMQSQPQTPVAPAPPTPTPKTPNVYSSGRTVTNTGTWTRPGKGSTSDNRNAKQTAAQAQVPTNSRAPQPEPANRRRTGTGLLEKERSFDTTSSRVSSAGSGSTYTARRGSVSRNTKPVSSNAPSPRTTNPPPASKPVPVHTVKKHPVVEPSPPPKTSFLTNSEKAKAVSKPKLVFRNQRSNSVSVEPPPHSPLAKELKSSHSRQSSVGSGIGTTPRGSNVAQMSRYTENRNVKPKTNSEKTIKAPASPLPRSRFSHQPTTPSDSRSNISSERSNISTERSNFSTERSNVSEPRKVTVVPSHGTYRISRGRVANVHGKGDSEGQGHARSRGVKSSGGVGMDSSWQMSKSNIEMDSDGIEPKMRTLAEIGRSSTFSKDEPTILGKMAVSVEYEGN